MERTNLLAPGEACLECRNKKRKCDGLLPQCSRCERLGKPCRYGSPSRKALTERLEDRIRELEATVQAAAAASEPRSLFGALLSRISTYDPLPTKPVPLMLPFYPGVSNGQFSSQPSGSVGKVSKHDIDEGYGSLIPRAIVENALRHWNCDNEVPSELRHLLVRLFLPHRWSFLFHTRISEFLNCLDLPPNDPRAIHPALTNAIFLAACSVGGGYMSEFEPHFLYTTRLYLDQALAYGDRLMHFMWASVILGVYYHDAGRLVEACNIIPATIRFAVGCGIHLDQEDSQRPGPSSMLPPPRSHEDVEDRAQLWYAIYLADQAVSLFTNSPSSAPHEGITSSDWLIYQQRPQLDASRISLESPLLLKTKGINLFSSITAFSTYAKLVDHSAANYEFWTKFRQLDSALSEFHQCLPSILDPRGIQPGEIYGPVNPYLMHSHFIAHQCTLLLYNISADYDAGAYKKMINAAHATVVLSKVMRGPTNLHPVQLTPSLMLYMYTAAEVFVREMHRSQGNSGQEDVRRLRAAHDALETLLSIFLEFTVLYPAWVQATRKLRTLLSGNEMYETI